MQARSETRFEHLFTPVRIGRMELPNRIMATPHASLIGDLWGPDEDGADRNIAYWAERARAGLAWMGGISAALENNLVPGFEPTGVGARVNGVFRLPFFHDRMSRLSEAMHAEGARATAQIIMQGGMPHGPSPAVTAYVANQVSHGLDRGEIAWFVEEYARSAGLARRAGLDGVELHANHDDLIEWFMSPVSNRREDEYGGDLTGRLRFVTEIIGAIRAEVGRDFTLGVRMNLYQALAGGYDAAGAVEIAKALEATGGIDYLSVVVGDNWGAPSYIQPHHYPQAHWADLAGRLRRAVGLPVVYTGRITTAQAGEEVLAGGCADVVGMARAFIADAEVVAKARSGRTREVRPCIGCNECIHRRLVDGLGFACSVNPHAGREVDGPLPRTERPKKVLVVGGGPAGMELSGLLAERGHAVTLWERGPALGGQMLVAGLARENAAYRDFVAWQEGRLQRAGVAVELGREATQRGVAEFGADVVAVATGSVPRAPEIPGARLPFVVEARDVLTGAARVGRRAVVVAMEDHMQPLTVAGFLADRGHRVHLIHPTPGPAPLVGKYTIGSALGALSTAGAEFTPMSRVVGIEPGRVRTRNVYSDVEGEVTGFDSVVIAAGGVADDGLHRELKSTGAGGADVHVLGDAYAPRRITFATRQAHALAALV
ncbi:2,4-dienoyl-CoA reductase-like NADH-dependent reductase (Old Yellow Enzyme family)/thioredoxin reductase [Spinactinospora alkalitolerans]|uniref:2,4-dienoyl-CoA reductase-like NADH-dependent reductase (Old Yellow Enzyme family)/thioredoxin reductase n=1 Tax=Spinactinospora alkalitolerans TaxID=687207 RepID=A0A852TZI8_9ACTN|nr:FAD-dependent oxidoreductase [Spinactinospora alkalitolerans]NYE48183.1 2,4-dienoyl-CoA reductase-like NADH-dependent reductase (Old Yellow Enzyme family)/thioredoxin reductase [Spinactinospora alkalitolerans]